MIDTCIARFDKSDTRAWEIHKSTQSLGSFFEEFSPINFFLRLDERVYGFPLVPLLRGSSVSVARFHMLVSLTRLPHWHNVQHFLVILCFRVPQRDTGVCYRRTFPVSSIHCIQLHTAALGCVIDRSRDFSYATQYRKSGNVRARYATTYMN